MRMLHTSDWHLGRSLHGVDLLDHQAAFLDHLVDVARTEQVDAVVVAGDVYDRAIPPVEAVTLLSETLARLAEHTTVVVTSGNHDSATRLGFGAALMRERIRLRTRVASLAEPVEVGGALVYGLPYLDPDSVRDELGDGEPLARSHEAVLGAAMRRVRADLARRGRPSGDAVVAAHAFVVGGLPSESERDIRVGGVDVVAAEAFAGVGYVALGHLHGAQQVTGPQGTVLRYSGSPLAYSFSEARQVKSSVLVEAVAGQVRTELVPCPVPRRLADVTGTLADLLGAAGEAHVADWVRVTVTDDVRPGDLYARVRGRFPHALVVQHEPPQRERASTSHVVPGAADPVQVAADFVAHVTGRPADDGERAVLRAAYEDVVALERSA
ncbi:exonuclease SbcCD subunit D [Cellulomonas composti]|uniref:Nuclease SbcCD subunit D n=1 Tax=Cellulomonas composti TaxID=266130 RepID=A0A511J846_9CELL|nr:exonuclease SbcCD subunit D [Cellulomonas composti]GEL94165.1 nuclease SbcCD subunit D [Cellulomonas composti]